MKFLFRLWNGAEMYYPHENSLDEFSIAHLNDETVGHWMQWTGLRDQRGQPIYEEDLLLTEDWRGGPQKLGPDRPMREDGKCVLIVKRDLECGGGWNVGPGIQEDCIVIGNRYETPHLMKELR